MAAPHSDAAKMEQQIITELFSKTLHVILESRVPCAPLSGSSKEKAYSDQPSASKSSMSSVRRRDNWFNLALKDCPAVLGNLETLRKSDPKCVVIDVILVKKMAGSVCRDFGEKWKESLGSNGNIIERWVMKYEVKTTKPEPSSMGSKRSGKSILCSLYKKSIILLRSLYATVRLLPAYKLFRQLSLSNSLCSCFLAHKVSSFDEPFDPKHAANMQLHGFAPLYTPSGKLCLSVLYLSRLPQEDPHISSMHLAPKIIANYVDCPLTRQESLPGKTECHDEKKPFTSFLDEFDLSKITCAFDLAANIPINSSSRASQLAAAGTLVETFQKAQPLRCLTIPRASADDAFREFQGYVQMSKSLNHRQGSLAKTTLRKHLGKF